MKPKKTREQENEKPKEILPSPVSRTSPRAVPRPKARSKSARRPPATARAKRSSAKIDSLDAKELDSLRAELERLSAAGPPRWNADPDDVKRSVGKLVLTLVEFIRQVLERQAIRRMDAGTLTDGETEAIGLALMRLEETIRDLAGEFGLSPGELTIDLGPLGKLV